LLRRIKLRDSLAISGVLFQFMLAVLEGRSPTIYGDGEHSRDFIYIENVVDLTLRAAETPGASAEILNGGTGARITLNEVVHLLGEPTGRQIVANYGPPREGDIRDSQADISLAKQTLGYEPRVQFFRRSPAHLGVVSTTLFRT
jgi:UDP-glucose 4-epimerase